MLTRVLCVLVACMISGGFLSAVKPDRQAGGQAAAQQGRDSRQTVWDGVYSASQASKGHDEFEWTCVKCHRGGEGPPVTGPEFLNRWVGHTVGELFAKVRKSMPEDDPGSLTDTQYINLVAYLLEANGFPAGSADLTPDSKLLHFVLSARTVDPPQTGTAPVPPQGLLFAPE